MHRLFSTAAICLLASGAAHATLGGDMHSVEVDRAKIDLSGDRSKNFTTYTTYDMSNRNIHIREFLSPTGHVFAVAWRGHVDTELSQLLGSYLEAFESADKAHPKRADRTPYRKVNGGSVIVEFWDLMRNLKGRAYAPGLMPAKFNPNTINMN